MAVYILIPLLNFYTLTVKLCPFIYIYIALPQLICKGEAGKKRRRSHLLKQRLKSSQLLDRVGCLQPGQRAPKKMVKNGFPIPPLYHKWVYSFCPKYLPKRSTPCHRSTSDNYWELFILPGGCCGNDSKKYINGNWGWAWWCVSDVQL